MWKRWIFCMKIWRTWLSCSQLNQEYNNILLSILKSFLSSKIKFHKLIIFSKLPWNLCILVFLRCLWKWFFKFKNYLKCRGEFVKQGCNKFSFELGDFVKQIMTRFISTLLSEVIHVQPCSYFHEISPCTTRSNFYIWLYLFRMPTIKEI